MTALINVQKEVQDLRREVMYVLRENLVSKQFCAQIILASVQLHLIAKMIGESQDLNEKKKLLHDFFRCKKVIKKWTAILNQPNLNKQSPDKSNAECHLSMDDNYHQKRASI
jgi:hypothetical protein